MNAEKGNFRPVDCSKKATFAGKLAKLAMLVVLLCPSMALADEPLSLKQAYDHALQYDARYLASEADTRIAKEEISKANSAFLPNIKASTSRGRNQTDHTDIRYGMFPTEWYNTVSHSVTVRQPLFNLASLETWKQAKAERAKSDSLFRSEHSALMVRTAEMFCNVLFAEENIAFTNAQVQATRGQLEQSRKRYENGFGTITEINEAQASYDLAIADQADAVSGLEFSRRELERVTGVYTGELCQLDSKKLELKEPDPRDADAWVSMAKAHSDKIGAAQQEIEIARKEIDKNRAFRYPQIDLWASRSYSVSENNYTIGSTYDTWSVGVQLSMPIYTGGYTRASVRQAIARKIKATEEFNSQERETLSDVRKYYRGQLNSIAQVKAYEQALKSNEIALEGTRKGFQAGFRTNTEVLDAMKKLLEVRRSLARARYQYILNRLMLKDSAGVLTERDMDEVDRFFVAKAGS